METLQIKKLFSNWKIDDEKILKLEKYKFFLLQENAKFNLTAIINDQDIYYKHFYDSLLITQNVNIENKKIMDIGTGAGFPGIIWKIFFDNIDLTLVESNTKKCLFLEQLCKLLNLQNVKILNMRVEEISSKEYEQYDLVVSRALAKLSIFMEIASQFLKINGLLISMKGINWPKEIEELNNSEELVGLQFLKLFEYEYEFDNETHKRIDLIYKKIAKTKSIYPRKYSIIKNKPLGS
ncbi:16S rRNA (guanine(527)-N(7))-methyltransferase RsmG [Spiroplasma endosymbiont of Labia minor]|uniref:16S rRNA (guanine(527)-N(7))-methyltransferase RsmG n=1 Tax=Spiroplasma endosymbiont of Labia minor TaxID=3066305 RepID=UPI0030D56B35